MKNRIKLEPISFRESSQCAHCDSYIRARSFAYSLENGDACKRACAEALIAADEDAQDAAAALDREGR